MSRAAYDNRPPVLARGAIRNFEKNFEGCLDKPRAFWAIFRYYLVITGFRPGLGHCHEQGFDRSARFIRTWLGNAIFSLASPGAGVESLALPE
jgi:hypothetical protein